METALQETAMCETEDRKQRKAAEDEEVKMIDLEEYDPLGESKRLRLSSALLRWQRSPPHRFSRRTLLLGGVAAVGLAGVASAWRGFAQPSAHPSFAPTRSSQARCSVEQGADALHVPGTCSCCLLRGMVTRWHLHCFGKYGYHGAGLGCCLWET